MINYPVDHKLSFMTDVTISPEDIDAAIQLMLESIGAQVVSHITYNGSAALQHDRERRIAYLEETQYEVYVAGKNCRRPTKEELEE